MESAMLATSASSCCLVTSHLTRQRTRHVQVGPCAPKILSSPVLRSSVIELVAETQIIIQEKLHTRACTTSLLQLQRMADS